ncbi:MAG: tetratricopeptide repeat protein [Aestuariivirga sp.]|nr:tetratricopeptide repeat protein [Aestuariivirga sp.]
MCLYHFACRVALAVGLFAGGSAFAADDDIQKCKSLDRYHDAMAAFYACDKALNHENLTETERAELLLARGEAAYFAGRVDMSLIDLDLALTLNPELKAAYYRRAWARMRTNHYPEALQDLTFLLSEEPDNADALYAIGYFYKDTAEWKSKAIPALKRALELDPNHHLARLNLASLYTHKQREFDAGLMEFDKILSASDEALRKVRIFRDPVRPYFDFRDRVRNDRIAALVGKADYDAALAEADSLIARYPGIGDSYLMRAYIYQRLRKFTEALADARMASKFEPNGDDQKAVEIEALYQLQRYNDALTRANEMLNQPITVATVPKILFWRAFTKKQLHLHEEALQDFEQSFSFKSWHLSAVLTQLRQSGYYDGDVMDPYSEKARNGLQACILDPECAKR